MLCFVFAALVVALDQIFKRWVIIMFSGGEDMLLIPKVIGLTYVENYGAAFSILSDMRWLLAGIAFVCVLILIAILMRYDDGFWGRLGLAAVLGGAVGNLADRVFRGYVVDMFEFKFVNFAVFNVADIFITLGGACFVVYYIISVVKESRKLSGQPSAGAAPTPRRNPDATKIPGNTTPSRSRDADLSGSTRRLPNTSENNPPPPRRAAPQPQQPAPQPRRTPPPVQTPVSAQKQPPPPPVKSPPSVQKAKEYVERELDDIADLVSDYTAEDFLAEYDLDKILAEYNLEADDN